ncbi:MAG: FtsW/RodA/SpoVE family cell cycle protein, partial [Pseudomonadota bacterium]|nr:FtsW/RodA/SpoVE family cell cycle protein [Pseudomonadota bacterium]
LLIGAQVLINVGVNTGVLPTKGLTLPFISYGGNSLLVCSMLMGLIQRARFEALARTARGHTS